ncbi:MAG: hypothetical protein GPOALKHO_000493 [Sodalis sp.]|nr:MAG: hypothetical protein GPOALKHO_000493 [Sodalis sp.]
MRSHYIAFVIEESIIYLLSGTHKFAPLRGVMS